MSDPNPTLLIALANARAAEALISNYASSSVDLAYLRNIAGKLSEAMSQLEAAIEGEETSVRGREKLEGMLMLDIGGNTPLETDETFALSISEVMQRTTPPEIARLFANSELES